MTFLHGRWRKESFPTVVPSELCFFCLGWIIAWNWPLAWFIENQNIHCKFRWQWIRVIFFVNDSAKATPWEQDLIRSPPKNGALEEGSMIVKWPPLALRLFFFPARFICCKLQPDFYLLHSHVCCLLLHVRPGYISFLQIRFPTVISYCHLSPWFPGSGFEPFPIWR